MNTDIRLLVSFKGHRKRKRLSVALGYDATGQLIDLWLTAAMDRPDGLLTDWDDIDIALAAGYDGNAAEFVKALIDTGWIDVLPGGERRLHDWDENQPWASGAQARSEAARNAANARWKKRLGNRSECPEHAVGNADECGPHAEGMPGACGGHSGGHAEGNAPSPIPSPSPKPTPKKTFSSDSDEIRLSKLLFDLILENDPKARSPDFQKWAVHVDRMIRLDERTPEEIEAVIRWCQADEFWKGNILSTTKLRDQFSQLVIKSKEPGKNPKPGKQRGIDDFNGKTYTGTPADKIKWLAHG